VLLTSKALAVNPTTWFKRLLDYFGYSVAMSETGHLVVGARWDDDKGYSSGAVYLFRLNSTSNTWGDEQKIVASDGAADDLYGYAVAMSETGHLLV
jgi:hypothetical protein